MVEIGITKMSTKGQIVVPSDLRKGFKKGEKLIIIKTEETLLIKTAENLEKNLIDDLRFAERTEKAWKKYEKGKFKTSSKEDFIKELEKC